METSLRIKRDWSGACSVADTVSSIQKIWHKDKNQPWQDGEDVQADQSSLSES